MGRDKANLPYDGTTLGERTVSTVGPRCSPVFVIAAPGQPLPALEAQVLRDEDRGVGPLLATGRGLRAAADAGLELAFVCAVDMPLLDADLIDELAGPAVRLGADVVLPWDGRDHYLAGIYRTSLADHVAELVAPTLFLHANSWYIGANIPGKPVQMLNYPGGLPLYRAKYEEAKANDFAGFQLT